MSEDANTPLLPGRDALERGLASRMWAAISHVENRILYAGFLVTLSFSYTQVPYVDQFPPPPLPSSECSYQGRSRHLLRLSNT